MLNSAIIPAAGLGTRMLPFTKETPKEMLPVIVKENEDIVVKPALHFIFDALYEAGIRRFYFVVGRGKRIIEDYFTPDWNYVDFLIKIGKDFQANILKKFYKKIEESELIIINQPVPRGFGDAVLRTKSSMTDDAFIVHAGDDIIYPDHKSNIIRLMNHYLKFKPKVVFLYDISEHPEMYGVIIGEDNKGYIDVYDVIEKPRKPISNRVIVAIYIFDKDIYEALEKVKPNNGEHQLTDAIRYLLKRGEKVHAIKVRGRRLDIGSPKQYLNALKSFVEENM